MDSDLPPFFGGLTQSENISELRPPLLIHWRFHIQNWMDQKATLALTIIYY